MRKVALDLGGKKTTYCEVAAGAVVQRATVSEVSSLRSLLGPEQPAARVAIEACREAWYVHDLLTSWGNQVLLVDTTRSRQLGIGQHGRKTDRIDAEVLARAVERGGIPLAHVLSPHRRELRRQIGVRRALVQTRANLVTTIRGLSREDGNKLPSSSSAAFAAAARKAVDDTLLPLLEPLLVTLEALEPQLAVVEQALGKLCSQEPVIAQLTTAPGVGALIAASFVSVIDDAKRLGEDLGQVELAASLPVYSQQVYAKPFNTGAGDAFGALALSKDGNTMIVGADGEDGSSTGVDGPSNELAANSGAAYVLRRDAGIWSREVYLKASNTEAGDLFGHAVAISGDGNTVAISALGEDSASVGINQSGASNAAADSGAVYVFTRGGSGWTQQAYIKASNTQAGDGFGWSVALSDTGDTLAVGARAEDSGVVGNQNDDSASGSGAVYVFQRTSGTWAQQGYLKASNVGAGDGFGTSVSLAANGSTLAVGAYKEDTNGQGVGPTQNDSANDSGAAYVFSRSGSSWSQQSFIKAHDHASVIDYFGGVVRLSGNGNTLAVGSGGEDSAATGLNGDASSNALSASGAVFTYTRSGSTWSTQAYFKAHNANAGDSFGDSLALSWDGTRLAVTALSEDSSATGVNGNAFNEAASGSGAVYTFGLFYGSWVFTNYVKASNTGAHDSFGLYLALSEDGSTLAAGAVNEDSNATNFGGNQANNTALDSGAAYVFTTSASVSTYAQQAYVKPSNVTVQPWC